MQVLMTRWVARWVRQERIPIASLREAIERAERGLVDADLGGGLIKQRVARPGKGRSGGYRTLIAYRRAGRAIFLYAFAKSDRSNIASHELEDLRRIGATWLQATPETLHWAIDQDKLKELEP